MQSAYVIFIALLLGGASTSSGRMLPGASDLFGLPTIVESPKTVGEAYDMQLADLIQTVFMAHSGANLETSAHLNASLVVTAAELALENFFHQVETFVNGTSELVHDLPEDVQALPQNVSDALASQAFHAQQLENVPYLLHSFDQLVSDLENPQGITGGAAMFSYNPCFIDIVPAAIKAFATGVSVSPTLVGLSPQGIVIQPQGLNISPGLVRIFPVGVNIPPQGLNVAPALIAVTPGRVSINPQAGTITPVLLSVSAEQSP